MKFDTKLIFFFKKIYKQARKKIFFFQAYFTNNVFFLLLGFLTGNLFGSLLNIFQESIIWHGFITMFIIFVVEITNYLIYKQPFVISDKDQQLTFYTILKKSLLETLFFSGKHTKSEKQKLKFKIKKIRLLTFNRIKSSSNNTIDESHKRTMLYCQNRYFKFPFKLKKKNVSFLWQILQFKFNIKLPAKKNKRFWPVFAKKKEWKITADLAIKSLNLFKIGILLGFFIDAFKVGS